MERESSLEEHERKDQERMAARQDRAERMGMDSVEHVEDHRQARMDRLEGKADHEEKKKAKPKAKKKTEEEQPVEEPTE